MATSTTTSTTAPTTALETARAESTAIEVGSIAELKKAYAKALGDWSDAKKAEDSAVFAKNVAAVWMSRIAYRAATHPTIATARYTYNITGAAKALGMPVPTLRPYALAGQALHTADRAGLLSVPNADDIAVVEASFEAGARADQKEKRIKEKAKREALEAKAKELEALKAKNAAGTPATPATGTPGTDVPATAGTPATDGPTPATPATAGTAGTPATPATDGPSLSDDVVATAKTLVAQIKKLRADKTWRNVAPKVVAALAEVFPALKA